MDSYIENLNDKIKDKIAAAVLASDWDEMAHIRYQEGDVGFCCYIENLDLSGRELGEIPDDFLCFKNCNLDNASFSGRDFSPLSLWGCNAKGLDLRNYDGLFFAYDTNLSEAKFDETTMLHVKGIIKSGIEDCVIDDEFKKFITKKGVTLKIDSKYDPAYYGFGVMRDELIKTKGKFRNKN